MLSRVKKGLNNFFAPFKLLSFAKVYIWWILCLIFFGLLNLWVYFFLGLPTKILAEVENGIIYSFGISICAPYIANFSLEVIDSSRKRNRIKFAGYKVPALIMTSIYVVMLTIIWLGKYRSSFGLQAIVLVVSLFFVFYMYCVSEMTNHVYYFREYDDSEYLTREKKRMNSIEEDANIVSSDEFTNWRKK